MSYSSVYTRTRRNRGLDQRLDRPLLDVFQHPNDHVTTALDHPEDRGLLRGEGAASALALMPAAPLFNVLKALLIVMICIFALMSAVNNLLQGGHALELGLALVYAVCASLLCLGVAAFLRRQARLCNSPLVEVDAKGWLIDGLISSTICLAFGLVWMLEQTAWARYTVYTDSTLVIILIVLAIPIPLHLLHTNLREVLLMASEQALQEDITCRFHAVIATHGLHRARLRILKLGRAILVLAHVLVEEPFRIERVQDLDAVCAPIREALRTHHAYLTIDVLFTAEAQMLDT